MRLKFGVLFVVIAAVSVASPLSPSSALETPGTYIAMGDSATQIGSSSNQRYPERFFSALQQGGFADTLRNIGVNGETSASILGAQLTNAQQIIDDTNTDTGVVTVDIGGNDALGNPACNGYNTANFSLDNCQPFLQTFATNFASLLDSLNASLANDPGTERLLVMAYYNPASGRPNAATETANFDLLLLGADHELDCAGTGTDLGLNDLIACVGAQHGADLADVYPPFLGKGQVYYYDTIHPNDLGHQAIADVFTDAYLRDRAPVASAGPDQAVNHRTAFTLDASGSSDPDGDPLTYHWREVSGPAAVIRDDDESTPQAQVDGVAGPATLTFEVRVTDPAGRSSTDEVVVTVRPK